MNARELLDDLESGLIDEFMSAEVKAIYIRALRLLAAAEANDGTTPETDAAVYDLGYRDESGMYIKQDAIPIDFAQGMERQRNALAARVLELEEDAESFAWCVKNARWIRHEHEAYVAIPVALSADLSCEATRLAAIDAARGSKP